MNLTSDPGRPAAFFIIAGDSVDGHPHGGREHPQPPMTNRRVQVRATDHPSTDRWIALTTVQVAPSPLFRVAIVDGLNRPTEPPHDYPTLRRARTAANKLHAQLTRETETH